MCYLMSNMICMSWIVLAIDGFHLLFILTPLLIYLVPISVIHTAFKYILFVFIMNPLLWQFSGNKCIMTKLTENKNDTSLSKSSFSEKYFAWIYRPILELFNMEWTGSNIDTAVIIHYGINLSLLWIFLFYVGKEQLI